VLVSKESNGRCGHCDNKKEGELVGKTCVIKISLAQIPYDDLGKRHTGNDRQLIQPGEFHTIQDFAERLTLRFNNEIQTEHFGGYCTVSLEGVAVRFFTARARRQSSPVMEFFTFLSDSKVQDSSVVNYNRPDYATDRVIC